jgi:hypothetical protein
MGIADFTTHLGSVPHFVWFMIGLKKKVKKRQKALF